MDIMQMYVMLRYNSLTREYDIMMFFAISLVSLMKRQ